MTPQEQQMIDGLISRIRNTPAQNKDSQAEQHIQQGLANFPDALYVLVQTVLVQQYGLDQAQSQINELKQQVQTLQSQSQEQGKSSSGSFLSHIFGGGSTPAPPQQGQSPQYQPVNNPGYNTQGYPSGGYPPPPPPAYPSQGYPAQGGGIFGGGGGGSFLQGAMQTAAGVAAGEMVFRGMEDLFHGFGGNERGFSGGGGGGGETIVNNYYDDDRGSGGDGERSSGSRDDSGFYNPDDDASRNDLGTSTQDLSDTSNLGSNDFADSGSDDSNFDDSGNDDLSSDNS